MTPEEKTETLELRRARQIIDLVVQSPCVVEVRFFSQPQEAEALERRIADLLTRWGKEGEHYAEDICADCKHAWKQHDGIDCCGSPDCECTGFAIQSFTRDDIIRAATSMRSLCIEKVKSMRNEWLSKVTEEWDERPDLSFDAAERVAAADKIVEALESLTLQEQEAKQS